MLPYWIVFAVFAAGSLFHVIVPRDRSRMSLLLWLCLAATALFIGLRFEVGADWFNYIEIFRQVRNAALTSVPLMSDPAYMMANALASLLGLDIWFANLVCAIIFTYGLARFAVRQPNPWLAIAVACPYLIIVVAMGYTRQSVAISLLMIAIADFEDSRYLRFIAMFALAAAFHKSVVLVLPLIALSTVRQRFAIYSIALMLGSVLFLLFLDAFIDSMSSQYIEGAMESQGAGVRVAMNIVPAAILLLFLRRFVLGEQERVMWRNFAIAALISAPALAFLPSTAVDRLALYLIPLQIYVLARVPYAFAREGRRNDQMLVGVLLYSAAVQIVWLGYAQHADAWLPYRTVIA